MNEQRMGKEKKNPGEKVKHALGLDVYRVFRP